VGRRGDCLEGGEHIIQRNFLSLFLSLSCSFSFLRACSFSRTLSLSFTCREREVCEGGGGSLEGGEHIIQRNSLSLSLSLSRSFSFLRACSFSRTLSLPRALSLPCTHTYTHPHAHTHTHAHSHAQAGIVAGTAGAEEAAIETGLPLLLRM